MKHIYIDSYLDSVSVAGWRKPEEWIFSQGKPWLLLTPRRLSRIAACLGLEDCRVDRLVDQVCRYSGRSEEFCGALGMDVSGECYDAEDYPVVVCPDCDCVHQPHPRDAAQPCPECRERERRAELAGPGPLEARERELNELARGVLREVEPALFCGPELLPNWRYNFSRRLVRDWEAAINRILTGGTYRVVAREFDCSVGLLHRKVKEHKFWDNN